MPVLILPTLGSFHILHPRYNAVTILEMAKAYGPRAVLLASYAPAELEAGLWRDVGDLPLFHLLPWAERNGLEVAALDKHPNLKVQAEQFRQALAQFPRGQEFLAQAAELERRLQALLTRPLLPDMLSRPAFVDELWNYLDGFAQVFGEGPATGFRAQRMQAVAEQIGSRGEGRWLVISDLLDYPYLLREIPGATGPGAHASSPAEADRAILDRAWRLEEKDDWSLLLQQLQEIADAEAQYLAAQIYLAAGRPEDALALMEALLHSEFAHPAYLPGYVLARYGQLQDLAGNRQAALRAYQAALALSWVPAEAREIALAGQRNPFKLG
ncbi:conserved hypothetical protein [Allomeiothermus silvanus DSM 9946]|uniref:Uncharacterized protein n=1 Tax=Allomeiothermus silvanus (strain ATCC 700542 / DSM 9946 / NBRC 106475 / NCIMB 13440 / VI-R2) TaxID=526227 RepID=D7BCK8_ALLS1|nr:hypothetical protein [Allomeiothermus silvanus]ADH62893.1 conserved hypothetical protein [Allomeiothermus silvanus DSM 9946]